VQIEREGLGERREVVNRQNGLLREDAHHGQRCAILDRQTAEEPFTNANQIRQAIGEVENAAILAQLFNVRSSLFRLQASALTNVDPEGEHGGGIGQTVSELVVRRQDPRRRRPDRQGPGWTLRPLDWQKEGGARLFRAAPDDVDGLDSGDDTLLE